LFHVRFGADPASLGGIFFAANLLAGVSALAAAAIARRFGLVNTMVFTHVRSNVLLVLVSFMPTLSLAITLMLLLHRSRGGPERAIGRGGCHFLVIVKGLFLKDLPSGEVARYLLRLGAIAAVTLTAASRLFRRRME
jgi:hypothetical protein